MGLIIVDMEPNFCLPFQFTRLHLSLDTQQSLILYQHFHLYNIKPLPTYQTFSQFRSFGTILSWLSYSIPILFSKFRLFPKFSGQIWSPTHQTGHNIQQTDVSRNTEPSTDRLWAPWLIFDAYFRLLHRLLREQCRQFHSALLYRIPPIQILQILLHSF